jgi:hypothetical protein
MRDGGRCWRDRWERSLDCGGGWGGILGFGLGGGGRWCGLRGGGGGRGRSCSGTCCQLIVFGNQGKKGGEVDYILVACLLGGLLGAAVTLRGIRARN